MAIADRLLALVTSAAEELFEQLRIDPAPLSMVSIDEPAVAQHGDYASNAALVLAKTLAQPPRHIAEILAQRLRQDVLVDAIEVAGPGFLNIWIAPWALAREVIALFNDGEEYFRTDLGRGATLQVEFVSANPTGPLHVGNGWLATYGDALSRLMAFVNYRVTKEYYVNDTGGQIRQLGASILAVRTGAQVPEGGYQGAYISELAARYEGSDDVVEAGNWAVPIILDLIRTTLDDLGIQMDNWFSQASIEESGAVADVVGELASRGAIYEREGALWFASESFGDSRDRVMRKSNGDFTYLAGDIAYHYNKLVVRGFSLVIDVFGADHHGQVASMMAAIRALGIDEGRLEIKLGQMVSLLDNGQAVKFSKRAGTAIPLDWLIEELGRDATRLLILSSSIDRASQIDLAQAKAQSMENPVFYIQYAHARISALLRNAVHQGVDMEVASIEALASCRHPREVALMKNLLRLGPVIVRAAEERAPHKIVGWLMGAASDFHGFYHDCPVLSAPPAERTARLTLARATQVALATALDLLGVAPLEEM
ncbi:MAG: arginine--tRNA ligase [Ferrimicrobium sp.]|uniref:Arginine--tRNA ligase n=1 Tax=Ferrimicrobium acidiphilum TaxID=121039 RepID=A0ABV3Y575_9ACTN|nr:arginine--tRNA ligase [Ferrimicrobium sp.]